MKFIKHQMSACEAEFFKKYDHYFIKQLCQFFGGETIYAQLIAIPE